MYPSTVTSGFSKAILKFLPSLGIALPDALRRQVAACPAGERLPLSLQDQLWQAIADHADCDGVGLRIGRQLQIDQFDMLGFLLLSSVNLAGAVDNLLRFSDLVGEGGRFARFHSQEGWHLVYRPHFEAARAARLEAIFASVMQGAAVVASGPVIPKLVAFEHSPQAPLALYHEVFGDTQVCFARTGNYMVFSDEDWLCSRRDIQPELQAQLIRLAQQQMKRLAPASFLEQISHLLTQQPSLTRAQTAALCNLSERHLNRKLADFGVSFRALSEQIKKQQALQMLNQKGSTQANLALYFGYADDSAFAKAFKRWTGMGIRDYRASGCDNE
ncbi:AraC family transcriptional regulator [Photobacterium sp. WH77]|uniref:AraC family transcriptional regulator n=1 Tax=unclassified Photobacterium TaxID=2628852 RepID=UPI001EDA04C7|nr:MULTISPECIES: AraC family transcriptional regulator [unclassified Photobacterium]MCG2837099.1 AraC family transcriptional regulator [Photobacterium sp. WH77]MCG2844751.1 AraC family transcriptional regulator [Photobacterium sp. WH80]